MTLVAVSKRQPEGRIRAGLLAGLDHLGENFAQEARDKRERLLAACEADGIAPPRWHFIGQLQRNKARLVAPWFDLVETVDRASLAAELDRRAAAADRRLDVLLQVDLAGTPGRGGVAEDALPALLEAAQEHDHLNVRGLMGVPAAGADEDGSRAAFARLRALRDGLSSAAEPGTLRELSMGMSGDFEAAILEGATIVRVGTALFGPRGELSGEPRRRTDRLPGRRRHGRGPGGGRVRGRCRSVARAGRGPDRRAGQGARGGHRSLERHRQRRSRRGERPRRDRIEAGASSPTRCVRSPARHARPRSSGCRSLPVCRSVRWKRPFRRARGSPARCPTRPRSSPQGPRPSLRTRPAATRTARASRRSSSRSGWPGRRPTRA